MRVLLDTHILLWSVAKTAKLPSRARAILLDPENDLFVSTASLWEIAIKRSLNRGDMPVSAAEAAQLAEEAGFVPLTILPVHAIAVETLAENHHADPFDRLLVAQALSEPMHLLTHDKKLAGYGDHILLV